MKNMNTKNKRLVVGMVAAWALLGGLFAGISNTSATSANTNCIDNSWNATLRGTVVPNGNTIQAWFDWGTNTSVSNHTSLVAMPSLTRYGFGLSKFL